MYDWVPYSSVDDLLENIGCDSEICNIPGSFSSLELTDFLYLQCKTSFCVCELIIISLVFFSFSVFAKPRFLSEHLKWKWYSGTFHSSLCNLIHRVLFSSTGYYYIACGHLFISPHPHPKNDSILLLLTAGFIQILQVWDLASRHLSSKLKWESNITAFSVIYGTHYM